MVFMWIGGFVAFWYVFPLFGKNLREIPFLKAFIVSIIWTFILVILPTIEMESTFFPLNYFSFYAYFLGLTIPFDIRDQETDKPNQNTIPQLLGTRIAKVISICLILLFYIIFAYFNINMRFNILYWTSLFVTAILIFGVYPRRSVIYFALIDSSMALLGFSFLVEYAI